MNCRNCQNEFEELVLNPVATASAEIQTHLASCDDCRTELSEMRKTFALLDTWTAPEPSAWFDMKVNARLRSEQEAAPAGFFERLRARLLYNTGAQFRPMMAGALALVLVIGGAGTYISHVESANVPQTAVVDDLQILDRNDQAIQDMDLLDDNAQDSGTPSL